MAGAHGHIRIPDESHTLWQKVWVSAKILFVLLLYGAAVVPLLMAVTSVS